LEGFGIPVVEALAAGAPMACSDIEPIAGAVFLADHGGGHARGAGG